jgi:hypothetical protein
MADRMETGRNICIGAAGALYVYNLIDAIASPGAKRIVHGKNRRYAYTPVVTTGYTGIKLAINF